MARWGDAETRFWSKVNKTEDCWEWLGSKSDTGYGCFHDGRRYSTHRYAYERLVGPIPEGKIIMHSCDNRACVNPAHLSVGTKKQNSQDMARKQRYRVPGYKGQDHGEAKLTDAAVVEILTTKTKGRELARKFGVSESAVSLIRRGKSWTHVRERLSQGVLPLWEGGAA